MARPTDSIDLCLAMGVLVVLMGRAVIKGFDAADVAAIALVLAVGVSTAASIIPRLSLEALYAALAFAAIFVLVRRLGPDGRAATVSALTLVVAVLAPVMLVLWLATWIRWIDFTGLLPSLSIRLPSAPFGHPHDVALLMGLLAPAVVAGGLHARPRAAKLAGWLLLAAVIGVVFMSGGRATWVAAVAASIAVLVARGGIGVAVGWVRRWWVAGAMIAFVGSARSS